MGVGKRFSDLTPLDENGSQHATRREGLGLAIDHVLADKAQGTCIVYGDDFQTQPLETPQEVNQS